jgi:hypothetical protein
VDTFHWDVVMVPVTPTVHPDREGYHHNAHDTVTQNTLQDDHEKKELENLLRPCSSDGTELSTGITAEC